MMKDARTNLGTSWFTTKSNKEECGVANDPSLDLPLLDLQKSLSPWGLFFFFFFK